MIKQSYFNHTYTGKLVREFWNLRSLIAHITLHGLLVVSILSVVPWELVVNKQQDQISFLEGENEKEKEPEKEDCDQKKRKKNEKKDNKFLYAVHIVSIVLQDDILRSVTLKSEWDSPILAVICPPPEERLG